jgi:hypothetical protein
MSLDAGVGDKLIASVEAAVVKGSMVWGQPLQKQIREYVKTAFLGGAEDRVQTLENGGLNFGQQSDPEALKAESAAWQALVKQVLPAELSAQVAQRELRREERWRQSLVRMVVAELDRKVRLTPSQRAQMEPIFLKVVNENSNKMSAVLAQNYVNTEMMLMIITAVPEKEVSGWLAPEQLRGWREAVHLYSDWWNQY